MSDVTSFIFLLAFWLPFSISENKIFLFFNIGTSFVPLLKLRIRFLLFVIEEKFSEINSLWRLFFLIRFLGKNVLLLERDWILLKFFMSFSFLGIGPFSCSSANLTWNSSSKLLPSLSNFNLCLLISSLLSLFLLLFFKLVKQLILSKSFFFSSLCFLWFFLISLNLTCLWGGAFSFLFLLSLKTSM